MLLRPMGTYSNDCSHSYRFPQSLLAKETSVIIGSHFDIRTLAVVTTLFYD